MFLLSFFIDLKAVGPMDLYSVHFYFYFIIVLS